MSRPVFYAAEKFIGFFFHPTTKYDTGFITYGFFGCEHIMKFFESLCCMKSVLLLGLKGEIQATSFFYKLR